MKKEAEILVECGYGLEWGTTTQPSGSIIGYFLSVCPDDTYLTEYINPYADTLEGKRQADALEDYLWAYTTKWNESESACLFNPNKTHHQWRLDRIKWCIEQLGDK